MAEADDGVEGVPPELPAENVSRRIQITPPARGGLHLRIGEHGSSRHGLRQAWKHGP
jgi:hypothetical protein